MLLNGVFATIVAILGISIALVFSPWNTASLYTTQDVNATAATVREKVGKSCFSRDISRSRP